VTCLVTGATGNIGSLVTRRLIDRGDRPCVFVREAISDEEARRGFAGSAEDDAEKSENAYVDALVDIWRAIRKGRLATVTDGVAQLLGRQPITFEQWAQEHAYAFRRSGTTRDT
jgi:nucleoside-diphosphate-sugar epimerase